MPQNIYSVPVNSGLINSGNVASGAVFAMWEGTANSGKSMRLLGANIGNYSDVGDASEKQMMVQIKALQTGGLTSGTTTIPVGINPVQSGGSAATFKTV